MRSSFGHSHANGKLSTITNSAPIAVVCEAFHGMPNVVRSIVRLAIATHGP